MVGKPKLPIARVSLTPLLAARALYQLYLSISMTSFGLVAAMMSLLWLLILASATLAPFVGAVRSLAGEAVNTLVYLGPLSSTLLGFLESPAVVVLFSAIIFLLGLLAVPLAFLVMKNAAEDRLIGIALLLAIVAAVLVVKFPAVEGLSDWKRAKPQQINDVLLFFSMVGFGAFVILHGLLALATRGLRTARLSAGAPRIGVRGLLGKYFGGRWRLLLHELAGAAPALGFAFLRAVAFIAFLAGILLLWGLWLKSRPDQPYLESQRMLAAPVVVGLVLATLVVLWDLVRIKGLRLLNLAVLSIIVPNGISSLMIASSNDGILGGADVVFLGQAAMTPILIAGRGVLLKPLRDWFGRFRRNLLRTASQVAADADKPPILLLRAFADDQAQVEASFRAFTFGFGGVKTKAYLEEAIAEALFARGPVIALSDPQATRPPPLGAARDVSDDASWRDYVTRQIDGAQLVAVVLSRTDNLRWEIEQIAARGALSRTIFIAPPGYPEQNSLNAASAAMAQAVGVRPDDEIALGGSVRAIAYDVKRGAWTAVSSVFAGERAYSDAVRVAAGLALGR